MKRSPDFKHLHISTSLDYFEPYSHQAFYFRNQLLQDHFVRLRYLEMPINVFQVLWNPFSQIQHLFLPFPPSPIMLSTLRTLLLDRVSAVNLNPPNVAYWLHIYRVRFLCFCCSIHQSLGESPFFSRNTRKRARSAVGMATLNPETAGQHKEGWRLIDIVLLLSLALSVATVPPTNIPGTL